MALDEIMEFSIFGGATALVLGLLALVFNSVNLVGMVGVPIFAILLSIGLIYIYASKGVDVDKKTFAYITVLGLMVAGIGGLVTGLVPALSPYILSTVTPTITGFGLFLFSASIVDAYVIK